MVNGFVSMAHEHLIKWGKDAFGKSFSLAHIGDYLLKRGMKRHEALKTLHGITAFEHKIHEGAENLRKMLVSIPILVFLILYGAMILYIFGIIKMK